MVSYVYVDLVFAFDPCFDVVFNPGGHGNFGFDMRLVVFLSLDFGSVLILVFDSILVPMLILVWDLDFDVLVSIEILSLVLILVLMMVLMIMMFRVCVLVLLLMLVLIVTLMLISV